MSFAHEIESGAGIGIISYLTSYLHKFISMNYTAYTVGGLDIFAHLKQLARAGKIPHRGQWHNWEVAAITLYILSQHVVSSRAYLVSAVELFRRAHALRMADIAKHLDSAHVADHRFVASLLFDDIARIQAQIDGKGAHSVIFKSNSLKDAHSIYRRHIAGRNVVFKL